MTRSGPRIPLTPGGHRPAHPSRYPYRPIPPSRRNWRLRWVAAVEPELVMKYVTDEQFVVSP